MKTIITVLFVAFSYLGFAQLIDPFSKIITHEIKLNKLGDSTYVGVIEWTTGGIDSLQRFVINDLDIKAPVMVTILTKAPDHNIDLGFYKQKRDVQESKISTNGEKFAHKIFRTMGTTGLGISSKVEGIPYLITVKVGLQFPLTRSLIRITDNKDEYTRHMRSRGYQGVLFGSDDTTSSNNVTSNKSSSSSNSDNSLVYIIIGLLAVIAILFAIFILKSKSSKTTMLLLCFFGFSQLAISQGSVPHNLPITDMRPVFIGYQTQNVENQLPITYGEPGLTPAMNSEHREINGDGIIRIQPNQSSNELSGEEVEAIQRRMNEDSEQFDRDYGEGSPGEETDGDQRTLPTDRTIEELNRLRRQVQRLQAQVDRLSAQDSQYDNEGNEGEEILIFCERRADCQLCIQKGYGKFMKHYAYYRFLQNYYRTKRNQLDSWMSYGDALASTPGAGLGWGPIKMHKVIPSMGELDDAYHDKFDYYIEVMENDLHDIERCYSDDDEPSNDGYANQVFAMIQVLKATEIDDYY
jgi:hypothetical protein